MWTTKCSKTVLLILAIANVLPAYGQIITCIPWMATRSISLNCSRHSVVFIDTAYVKKTANENSCAASDDEKCTKRDEVTEYVRTMCFNQTSCFVDFYYGDYECPGHVGTLYVYVRHRCQSVFDVDGKELLPSAVIGGRDVVDESGVFLMMHSPMYPGFMPAKLIQCRLDIPASTVVRLDIMDLSNQSPSLRYKYSLTMTNSSDTSSFERGRAPSTVFWNNTQNTLTSINMTFTADQSLTQAQILIRFYIFISVMEFDNTYSDRPVRIVYPANTQTAGARVPSNPDGNNSTKDNNATAQESFGSNDYNIVAVIAGATVGALLLVLIVSIISVILGTRQRKQQQPPPPKSPDQELRYHVHANKIAINKMHAILENRENVSAMQQVKDLNEIIVSSSTIDFGTVDSRAPLQTHIMAPDAAEDSAYDSSTEPVRSLEDLTFSSNTRRQSKQSQDNPLFFSLHRNSDDGGPRSVVRTHSLHELRRFDHPYENHQVIEKTKPPRPRPNSALAISDHEYVNDFLPRRPTRRKGHGGAPVRRSFNNNQKRPGRYAKPQRTQSWYNTRVDHVKHPKEPKDSSYNTQPPPQLRKNPRKLQTIPSVGSDEYSPDENYRLSSNNRYSFHIRGSTQSLSDAVYGYPSSIGSIDKPGGLEQPRGLLFFSNNSIHAMCQDKKSVPLDQLYAVPQKKKKSGFVKLAGADTSSADHDA